MKKLPYFPFYYLDWLSSSSVSMMTHEEKGLFIDMLSRCYNDDGLPDDNNKLQRLFNCTDDLLWTVKEMFYSVDGLLKNEKLDSIIKDQSIMVKGKSKAGKASAKARADKKLQSATPVQHVLNPVATEVQRNSTNRTEQNKAEQNNKDIKSKPKKDAASISINPEETTKPKPDAFARFFEIYPKRFNPMCPKVRNSFFQAVSIADGEDVILVAASMYAEYFEKTGEPLQYASSVEKWLDSQSWKTDWNAEIEKKNSQGKKAPSTSRVSKIKAGDVF
jgi:uncharacterized protein YdaU (DUF1376 family)